MRLDDMQGGGSIEDRRGEGVHVVAPADRPDLTSREEPRQTVDTETLPHHRDVVIGRGEQLRTTAVARKEQHAFDGVEARRLAEE